MPAIKFRGVDFIQYDSLLTDEEKLARQTARQFVDDQQGEDLAATRLGHSVEDIGGGSGSCHEERLHSHMGMCQVGAPSNFRL